MYMHCISYTYTHTHTYIMIFPPKKVVFHSRGRGPLLFPLTGLFKETFGKVHRSSCVNGRYNPATCEFFALAWKLSR